MIQDLTETEIVRNVAGHDITQAEWKAYEMLCAGKKVDQIALEVNRATRTINEWKSSEWWRELDTQFFSKNQEDFKRRMAADMPAIYNEMMGIITGADKEDRTANARVQMIKAIMEA